MIKILLLVLFVSSSVISEPIFGQRLSVNWRPTVEQLTADSYVAGSSKVEVISKKELAESQEKTISQVKTVSKPEESLDLETSSQEKKHQVRSIRNDPYDNYDDLDYKPYQGPQLILTAQEPVRKPLAKQLVYDLIAPNYTAPLLSKQNYHLAKCPSFTGAQNNDFENTEGLWFKVEAVPEILVRTVCSLAVFQLTSKYTNKVIERLPELNLKCHNDGTEIVGADSKKIHQSAYLSQVDTTTKTWLSTVLVSDYALGYFMLHKCNVNDPNEQLIEIFSRKRHLDPAIVDALHQYLIDNGMANLESLIAIIPQDLKYCQNCLNTYIINKY